MEWMKESFEHAVRDKKLSKRKYRFGAWVVLSIGACGSGRLPQFTFDGAGHGWSSHGRERRGSRLMGTPLGVLGIRRKPRNEVDVSDG